MTKIEKSIYGKNHILTQTDAHYIRDALEEFLVAEYPDTVLSSLIKCSIGLEIFLKKRIENINPNIIYTNINFKNWKPIRNLLSGSSTDQVNTILQNLSKFGLLPNKTIDFGLAIDIYDAFYTLNQSIRLDFDELRKYRNGVFHWKGHQKSALEIAQFQIRIFEWIFEVIEKEQDHYLGGDFNIIDPMMTNRNQLKKIKTSVENESLLNLHRRVYKHSKDYKIYLRINARLTGRGGNMPAAKLWTGEHCPACSEEKLQLYETGLTREGIRENKVMYVNCDCCDFTCSEIEFREIDPQKRNLSQVFEDL